MSRPSIPEPLTRVTVINFAAMMEEMSASGQSSMGRRVGEPSTSARSSVVKVGVLGCFAGFGNVLPFLFLEREALTGPRGCPSWGGPGPRCTISWLERLVLKVTVAEKKADASLLLEGAV